MEEYTKICKKCSSEKSINDFSKCKTCKQGRSHTCKSCSAKMTVNYINRTPEQKEIRNERARVFRKNNHDLAKLTVKFSSYKRLGLSITKEEYKEMYDNQKGLCKICTNPPTGFKKTLCLDHCHTTLKVRGLLCDNCNAGLGKFKDNIISLETAAKYLKDNG